MSKTIYWSIFLSSGSELLGVVMSVGRSLENFDKCFILAKFQLYLGEGYMGYMNLVLRMGRTTIWRTWEKATDVRLMIFLSRGQEKLV